MSLNAFAAPGQFWRGNLHTHSTLSDGTLSADAVCRAYADQGYDFICLSDHFLKEYDFPVADTRDSRTNRFTTILGAEVHSGAISHGDPWHILAVGLPLDFAATPDEESGPELAQRCANKGAFVAIAHPEWYGLSVDEARLIESAHAVEIYNHASAVHTARGEGAYILDALLNEGRHLTAIATDDAHFKANGIEQMDTFGGWVMVKAETNEPDALLAALKAGEFYSSTGPIFESMALDGDTLSVKCADAANIFVLGGGSRSDHAITTPEHSVEIDVARYRGHWFRIVAQDRVGKRAWSNPVWLD